MKKRLFAATLACLLLLVFTGSAFASSGDIQPQYVASVQGGLSPQGNGNYLLWGTISGNQNDSLSIRVVLKTSSGTYITETSKSGSTSVVKASKTVSLSSGTYIVYLYGKSSTHSPESSVTVTI